MTRRYRARSNNRCRASKAIRIRLHISQALPSPLCVHDCGPRSFEASDLSCAPIPCLRITTSSCVLSRQHRALSLRIPSLESTPSSTTPCITPQMVQNGKSVHSPRGVTCMEIVVETMSHMASRRLLDSAYARFLGWVWTRPFTLNVACNASQTSGRLALSIGRQANLPKGHTAPLRETLRTIRASEPGGSTEVHIVRVR